MDMQLLTVAQAEELVVHRSSLDWQSRSAQSARTLESPREVLDSASPIRPSLACRMDAWLKRKDERTQGLKETLDSAELQECSFRPKVRRPSSPKSVDVDLLVNRLSVPKKSQKPPAEALSQECTFAPDTDKSRLSFDRQGIFHIRENGLYSHRSLPTPVPCSHRPSTNAVRDNMVCCRAYLQENVFSRLARPLEQQDAQTTTVQITPERRSYPSMPVQWNGFLQRQNAFYRERDEWVTEKTEREQHAMFRPRLCLRSRAIAARTKNTAALDCKAIARQTSAPSFSFQPEIRERSKRLPRRSSYSLSIGDQMKKEDTIRKLREELQQEKDEKTKTLNAGRETEVSRVNVEKVHVVPDSLRERVAQRTIERQKAAQEEKELRDAEADKECSFRPKIKAAPAFVRRVAESYRLSRQIQGHSQPNIPEKTGWR
eukprot:GEMP01022293.1.p1 GENE.GEMP01022293.1~~GEMP01022293.1.p1  ORF type:complete len:430 (-),score=96.43 GEMP01022293.1:1099-2388(-)